MKHSSDLHPFHQELLSSMEAIAASKPNRKNPPQGYFGNDHPLLGLSVPEKRSVVKAWLKAHAGIQPADFFALLDSLYRGETNEEKTLGGSLLEYSPRVRGHLDLCKLEEWLEHLIGWQEIDSTCQSSFSAREILDRRETWNPFLQRLICSSNINLRRAGLVLLVRSVRESDDPRLGELALQQIRQVMTEKSVLLTKAVSWLLRTMSGNFPELVRSFLQENLDSLPKIVVREVGKKLETGRKSG